MRGARLLQSPLLRLRELTSPAPSRRGWGLASLQGRLAELSSHGASARLTAAFGLVLEAQKNAEPVAWVLVRGSSFLPADVAEGGVDLDSLAVVRAADGAKAARAAEQLARSGAFGLIVIDLDRPGLSSLGGANQAPLLTRLVGLCQKHETALVFLNDKPSSTASLSSLVSLRAEASRFVDGDVLRVRLEVLKDKRRGPGEVGVEECRAPAGLR